LHAPSFINEKWKKYRRNFPSSAFKAQIDPTTMLWRDMKMPQDGDLAPEQKGDSRPFTKPLKTKLGARITIESAEGIPIPSESDTFKRTNIKKRAIRFALFDKAK